MVSMNIRKNYLRWILPILVLLIMATILILGPALAGHAAGVKTVSPTAASTAPATPNQNMNPDWSFFN